MKSQLAVYRFVLTLLLFVCTLHLIPNCKYSKLDSNSIQRCTICQSNHQLNLNYTKCLQCRAYDSFCTRCDSFSNSTLFCQACIEGYKIVANKCVNIDNCTNSNCNTCIKATSQCLSCNQGFYLELNSSTCLPCNVSSQYDQGDETCACQQGFYLVTNNTPVCAKCQYPCQNCKESSKLCTLCIYGYFMSNSSEGICSLCLTPNCILCQKENLCLNCTLGYVLVGKVCQIQLQQQNIENYINLPQFYYFCLLGCFYCYKYDFCATCLQGYSRNLYNSACLPCSTGCKRCQSLQNMKCFMCYQGYRLYNHTCIKCIDDNCINCNTSQSTCLKCSAGYTTLNGKCQPCANNCLKCDKLGNGTCDQGQCWSGYARVSNTTCALCALGCYSCNPVDISTCISCPVGSFQIQGGQCQICPLSCITCQSTTFCSECRQGFRLLSHQCYLDCKYPCLECSPFNINLCSSCFDGYLLGEDMTCQPDISCNGFHNCTICPVGYYLDVYNSFCLTCKLSLNCIKCQTQSSKCAICSKGFYLFEKECLKCSSNCLTCQLQDYCFDCQPGYYLYKEDSNQVYGQCQACSQNCLTCIDQFDKCNSCNFGDKLIGFDCVSAQNIIFQLTMQHNSLKSANAQEFAFIKQIMAFTSALAHAFGPPYSSNPNLLYLKDISSGSIQVSYMATISDLDPRILLPTITTALDSFTSFNDFTVISTQVVINGFQSDIIVEPSTSVLIVSLMPAPFFVLFLVFAGYKFYQRRIVLAHLNEKEQRQTLQVRLQPMETNKDLKGDENGAITL